MNDKMSERKPQYGEALSAVDEELFRAFSMHGPWTGSPHEGWAIIMEEVDELWEEVRKRRVNRDKDQMRREAIQVAATAIRFAVEVCGK